MLNTVLAPIAGAVAAHALRLRYYQTALRDEIRQAWHMGAPNVLAVLPTGGGKTILFGSILADEQGASCAIAHRQELVGQISLALARYGVRHRIIGPRALVVAIQKEHMAEVGRVWVDPNAKCAVAGVDTLVRRGDQYKNWADTVRIWVQDEAHHVLKENKWGTAAAMFPRARGLGVTATPVRADGRGQGRHAHGVFDVMVVGPTMRQLIDEGFLTDYRIVVAKSDLEVHGKAGAGGDWSNVQLRQAARESHIIGDVVATYQKYAPGKLGVTFATDVETSTELAAAFNLAGISAASISAKTPDDERRALLKQFKRREIMMLVNCDLFGEGFDLPAIEVVIMARPTESFSLFAQQFGRALRLIISATDQAKWDDYTVAERLAIIAKSSKPKALIIDHVGNVVRHNLPDVRNNWTLDARENKGSGKSDADPLTYCLNPECAQVYEKYHKECPYCGHSVPPATRSAPEVVLGDLIELDAATLAQLRANMAGVAMPTEEFRAQKMAEGLPNMWALSHIKHHDAAHRAYLNLKDATEWLVGEWQAAGLTLSECYRRFYINYGMDVLSAYALPKADAIILAERIDSVLTPPSMAARLHYEIT